MSFHQFTDDIILSIQAGNGGAGSVSFASSKMTAKGGPNGGNGGKGGNIYIKPDRKISTLSHLNKDKLYHAEDGATGKGNLKTGRSGENLYIKVPYGTEIFEYSVDTDEKKFLYDCISETPCLLYEGGRGGKGNAFFKSSTNQAPKFSQTGEEVKKQYIYLSLKMIADIGLVGLPNAGKSTLLASLTNAKPKIGSYAFTTLNPNLATVCLSIDTTLTIADIPGIIEGATQGHGLGLSFLKHIERVNIILYTIDIANTHVEEEIEILKKEIKAYNPILLEKPFFIILNKVDLITDKAFLEEYIKSFPLHIQEKVVPISAQEKEGLEELKRKLYQTYQELQIDE